MKTQGTKYRARNRGAAVITVVVFLVIVGSIIIIGLSTPLLREYLTARDFAKSKESYYLSESGFEDVIYRMKKGISVSSTEVLTLGGNKATTTITTINSAKKTVASAGTVTADTRRTGATLSTVIGESFNYAMLVGPFGLFMGKNATVNGNVYSLGPVCGGGIEVWATDRCLATVNEGWWTYTNSLITGSAVSAGTTGTNGTVARIVNQGGNSMYAGTITNSTISGNAYCNSIYTSSTGTCNSLPAQPSVAFPISASDISSWESAANAGQDDHSGCSLWGTYTITTSTILGPEQFKCHLTIAGPTSGAPITITLKGPVWVKGNINITGKVNFVVDPSLAGQSVAMIADFAGQNYNTNIYLNDGYAKTFTGAAGGNSWIMLISTDTGVSQGAWSDNAIDVGNNVSGDVILNANNGMIQLGSSSVAEINGYGVNILDGAVVNYALGLQDVMFFTGPGGAWLLQGWKSGQ